MTPFRKALLGTLAFVAFSVAAAVPARAGFVVYTGNAGGFVANSATAPYLAAQGAPTEFLSFSVDRFGNPVGAGSVAGTIFSNNVTFSSGASATFGGANSPNVQQASGNSATSEIGPNGSFDGILNVNFLANGQVATAVGVGTVELESPLETIRVYNGLNQLVLTFDANTLSTFAFFGVVADNGDTIGRIELEGGFFAIQDAQFRLDTSAPIPEPATMILLGTGLAGVAARMRRRRQAE